MSKTKVEPAQLSEVKGTLSTLDFDFGFLNQMFLKGTDILFTLIL